ncbi:hypothetical protein BV22DRAFT_179542 [Leucogyrophana mollusca]|uniref:Uncharacterized protein n=1 Tax=Leucogyrophana mollusca TaxID=85980 RepID=A0ACB8BVA7_9AGAM|nr:hypothetical protein BV22DRAFT_179542 [Leucogyrophana mollusca]
MLRDPIACGDGMLVALSSGFPTTRWMLVDHQVEKCFPLSYRRPQVTRRQLRVGSRKNCTLNFLFFSLIAHNCRSRVPTAQPSNTNLKVDSLPALSPIVSPAPPCCTLVLYRLCHFSARAGDCNCRSGHVTPLQAESCYSSNSHLYYSELDAASRLIRSYLEKYYRPQCGSQF